MSRPGALSDNEIQSEMNKMVAFISQEAREKAREIQVKADEEFAIEKAKIVRQESLAIDQQYEKKRKQAETGWKISQSTALNSSRLKVLQARNDHLEQLFDDAGKGVKDLGSGDKYAKALEAFVLEVLLLLLAPQVTLAHRPKDSDLVKKATEAANKQYKEVSGRECKVEFDGSLPDDSAGGVMGSTLNGKIKVDNTLDERLKILREKEESFVVLVSASHGGVEYELICQMLPELRSALFGKDKATVSNLIFRLNS